MTADRVAQEWVNTIPLDAAAAREREEIFRLLLPELRHDINSPFSVVDSTFSNFLHTLELLKASLQDDEAGLVDEEDGQDRDADLHYMVDNLPRLIVAARERAGEIKATAEAMIQLIGESGSSPERLDVSYPAALNLLRGFLKHRVAVTRDELPAGSFLAFRHLLHVLVVVFMRAADGAAPGAEMRISWSAIQDGLACEVQCEGSFQAPAFSTGVTVDVANQLLAVSGGAMEIREDSDQRTYRIRFPIKEGYV
ncbi:MAG: hypothetical protein JXA97_07305 [Anaerolineales bacterium]|nr:hypothetical protein [Anaerolineales bacterium]